jgi:hypothetical protein
MIDRLGSRASYSEAGGAFDRTHFKNLTTYLPNHIHLLASDGTEPADNDTGPFFDQFIHGQRSLTVRSAFFANASSASAGAITQGFVGRFGSNGYNTVKTRGVLLGNEAAIGQERGATVLLLSAGEHVFSVAGLSFAGLNQSRPLYVPGAATFGAPNPIGAVGREYNPVITAASLNQDSGTLFMNVGLRSYVRGISPEHGFNITPNAVL